MTRCIAYTRPDGGLSVVVPVHRLPGETDEAQIVRILAKDVPPTTADATVLDAAELPSPPNVADLFRNAWVLRDGRVAVDMPKARDIQRERIRAARGALLVELDAEYLRADERGDAAAKAEIAARKQALRDATAHPAIEAAQTPDELKAVWPLPAATRP